MPRLLPSSPASSSRTWPTPDSRSTGTAQTSGSTRTTRPGLPAEAHARPLWRATKAARRLSLSARIECAPGPSGTSAATKSIRQHQCPRCARHDHAAGPGKSCIASRAYPGCSRGPRRWANRNLCAVQRAEMAPGSHRTSLRATRRAKVRWRQNGPHPTTAHPVRQSGRVLPGGQDIRQDRRGRCVHHRVRRHHCRPHDQHRHSRFSLAPVRGWLPELTPSEGPWSARTRAPRAAAQVAAEEDLDDRAPAEEARRRGGPGAPPTPPRPGRQPRCRRAVQPATGKSSSTGAHQPAAHDAPGQ